jgi:hypothetical protein
MNHLASRSAAWIDLRRDRTTGKEDDAMYRLWAIALGLSLGWFGPASRAEERTHPPSTTPLVTLGRPVALVGAVTPTSYVEPTWRPVNRAPDADSVSTWPGLTVGTPSKIVPVPQGGPTNNGMVSGDSEPPVGLPTETAPMPRTVEPPTVTPPAPGVESAIEPPVEPPSGLTTEPMAGDDALFGYEFLGNTTSRGRRPFESDHAFPMYISPVTSPFMFEDPRALTEVRPIFIYQKTPGSNYIFRGGDIEYFGTQLRLAVTDRLSFVINKLGFIWDDPRDGGRPFSSSTGFAEMNFGPKYTFWRNEETHALGAMGMTVQLPTGANKDFQNTGRASLVPYLTFAQNYDLFELGSLNLMTTTGYSFAVDNRRTDYYYTGLHLDLDIGNRHKIYPLVELNWFSYTSAGSARNLGFEGRDLINFGSTGVSGISSLTIATGARYKFTENLQTGLAVEFPLTATQDLISFRLTWDVILQY